MVDCSLFHFNVGGSSVWIKIVHNTEGIFFLVHSAGKKDLPEYEEDIATTNRDNK